LTRRFYVEKFKGCIKKSIIQLWKIWAFYLFAINGEYW